MTDHHSARTPRAWFGEARDISQVHAKVDDDWAIVTRFSRPEPYRYDRSITVFRRVGGHWRRSDELHRNTTFDADEVLEVLRNNGIDARLQNAFGDEILPDGLVVLTGVRALTRSGPSPTAALGRVR